MYWLITARGIKPLQLQMQFQSAIWHSPTLLKTVVGIACNVFANWYLSIKILYHLFYPITKIHRTKAVRKRLNGLLNLQKNTNKKSGLKKVLAFTCPDIIIPK